MEEIAATIDSLTSNTAPGLDDLTGIFYKTYKDILAPQLLEVYAEALEVGSLLPSMREAVISLLLKPGKDATSCSSYRPISLINFDSKILAKILVARLSQLLDLILSPAQSGFIPNRSTALNLRTVFFCHQQN